MRTKILGILTCILLFAPIVPVFESLHHGAIPMMPSTSNVTRKAFIFGRYANLTADHGYLTIETLNMWVIYQDPRSFSHFPRGTHITFEMYTAYGHMFQKIHLLFLHVELVV